MWKKNELKIKTLTPYINYTNNKVIEAEKSAHGSDFKQSILRGLIMVYR